MQDAMTDKMSMMEAEQMAALKGGEASLLEDEGEGKDSGLDSDSDFAEDEDEDKIKRAMKEERL